MTDSLDRAMIERFALQHDELPEGDFRDVRLRAQGLSSHGTGGSVTRRRVRLPWRVPTRVVLVVAVIIVAGGTATALAVHSLTQPPVTQGFSALTDPALPEVTETTAGVSPHLDSVFREVFGPGYTARQVGDGMFLAQRGAALCAVMTHGFGGCTSNLGGDVWLQGDEGREYDAETAPFQVHFYGFARDNVAAIQVTTADGNTVSLPVVHNAFQTTFKNTTFADITAIEIVYRSGQTTSLDPRKYYPAIPPTLTLTTPTGTATMTQTH